ncbi:MAG: glycosyltransferase family 2 protein [Candidatus Aminicenantales bacterium]
MEDDSRPSVSVIIPTYNRGYIVREAIQSVLDQEFFKSSSPGSAFELWVVDDGSTDSTRDVVASFPEPVKYIRQEHRGVSAARNLGLRVSSGDFIAFLDSDDLWTKYKMRAQMSFMQAYPEAMVCYTEETWIRNGVVINPGKKHEKVSGWIFERVLPLCLLSLSSAVFRRGVFRVLGDFDERLPVCEDYDFGIRLASRYPVHLIPRRLIIKRGGHADQLSKKFWGIDRFRIQALEKALNSGLTPDQQRLVRSEIVRKARILLEGSEKRGRVQETKRWADLIQKYQKEEDS